MGTDEDIRKIPQQENGTFRNYVVKIAERHYSDSPAY
jgi:hypothetical protein